MLSFDLRILVHILHIFGFSIGFACAAAMILLFLLMNKPRILLDTYRLLYYLTIIQGLTIIISAISGIIRLGYSTVLVVPDQRIVFFLKMSTLAVDILILVILILWLHKILKLLIGQSEKKKILSSQQFAITLLLIFLNGIFYTLTLILGGTLTIIS